MEFMKHTVDIILERSSKPRAFFMSGSDGLSLTDANNPLKTSDILFDF